MNTVKVFIFCTTIIMALGDSTVTISCSQCGDQICLSVNGGGFNGGTYPSSQAPNCQAAAHYPITYAFQCGNDNCSSGCLITVGDSMSSNNICSDNGAAQILLNSLNLIYSIQEGNDNLDSSYDWCGCGGGLSGGAIAGIVIGCVVGLGVIGGLVWYFCFHRKNKFDSYVVVQ